MKQAINHEISSTISNKLPEVGTEDSPHHGKMAGQLSFHLSVSEVCLPTVTFIVFCS